MKKLLTLLAAALMVVIGINAQSPSPGVFNYQGVARNSVGNVLLNKTITLRLTIHDGSAAGAVVYQESRSTITNPFGLFNVQVGSPGATNVTGTIAAVNWGVNSKYIQVEIDPNGGTTFINIGTAQIASVPYALYSSLSNDLVLPFNKTQADAGALFRVNNSGSGAGLYGSATSGAGVQGTATTGTGGLFSATSGLALNTAGNLRHTGIGEGAPVAPYTFKLLAGDAAGNATWQHASAIGLIGGNGTLNYVAKWTPNGTTLGNSKIFDDGTFVGIGTTTPGAGLVVSGNGIWNSAIGIQNTGSGMEWRMNVSGTTFGITKIPGTTFTPFTLLSDGQVEFPSTAGANRLRILDNGNVGVGLATPTHKLEVAGIARINNTTNQEGGELRFQEGTLFGAPNHWIIDNFQSFAGGNKFRLWNDVGGMNIQMLPGGKTAIGNMVFSDQPQSVLDVEGNLAVGTSYSGTTAAPLNGAIIEGTVGIGTNAPTGKLHVVNASTTAFNTALISQTNAGNTANAMNVTNASSSNTAWGNSSIFSQRGTGSLANTYLYTGIATSITAVAASVQGFGVQGTSESGYGVTGLSTTGIGVHGINLNSGNAARFENAINPGNTAPVVFVNNISTAGSVFGVHSVIAPSSPGGFSTALRGQNNGTGGLGIGVWGSQAGSGWGVFGQTVSGLGVYGTSGSGIGVYAESNTGWGLRATSNSGYGLYSTSNSELAGLFQSQTNHSGWFQTTAAGNTAASIVTLNRSRDPFGRAFYAEGSGYSGYYWTSRKVSEFQSDSTVGVAIISRYSNGIQSASEKGNGIYGYIFNTGGFGNAAVVGQSTNMNSHGLYGIAPAGGVGRALATSGPLQLTGIGEANNYVLTSDASGNATWQSLAGVGGVSGTGTNNYVTKWTPDGVTVGVSQMFDDGTNVGIGTISATRRFEVLNTAASGAGSFQINNAANINTVLSVTSNGTGRGIFAQANTPGFCNCGVIDGLSTTLGANAIYGRGVGNTTWGLYGLSNTSAGVAGIGWLPGSSGVYGQGWQGNAGQFIIDNTFANNSNVIEASTTQGGSVGNFVVNNTSSNADAFVVSTNTTIANPSAIHAVNGFGGISSATKKGLTAESDGGFGLFGTSNSSWGVVAASFNNTGLYATSWNGTAGIIANHYGTGLALYANANNGNAALIENTNAASTQNVLTVNNVSATGTGSGIRVNSAQGTSFDAGIRSVSTGLNGNAIIGEANNGAGAWGILGISSTGDAGHFIGNVFVQGNFTATGAKAFTIDHPLDPADKILRHAAIESNEVMNMYSGNIVTDNTGFATVQLPDYFESINKDFRYQLTVIGSFAQAIIKEKIQANKFVIQTNQPGIEVSWQVTAVRNDKEMLAHPFIAEETKKDNLAGKYISPELYGKPLSMGVSSRVLGDNSPVEKVQVEVPTLTRGNGVPVTPLQLSPDMQRKIGTLAASVDNVEKVEFKNPAPAVQPRIVNLRTTATAIPLVKPLVTGDLQKGTNNGNISKPADKTLDQLNKGQGTEPKPTEQPVQQLKVEKGNAVVKE